MKIGIIQYSPVWENEVINAEKLDSILNNRSFDAEALIFPEMTLTGFTMNSKSFAEEIDGFSTSYFMKKSRELGAHIFAGIIEKDESKYYNSLVHFDNTGLIMARYRKIHPFSMAKENENYTSGNQTVITKLGKANIGLSICYDLRFPELYRLYGKNKTQIIVNIANWPVNRINHWQTLLKSHAIVNQCFTIGVNRTGDDPTSKYNGNSCVFNPMGKEILNAKENEGLFLVSLDLEEVTKTRNKFPFLDDIKLI